MPLLILLVLIFLVVGVGVVAAGLGSGMPSANPDRDGALLPENPMRPEEVEGLRFSLGLRGYRMDEVDDVLDRLAAELAERDRQIDALHRRLGDAGPAGSASTAASAPGAGGSGGLSGGSAPVAGDPVATIEPGGAPPVAPTPEPGPSDEPGAPDGGSAAGPR